MDCRTMFLVNSRHAVEFRGVKGVYSFKMLCDENLGRIPRKKNKPINVIGWLVKKSDARRGYVSIPKYVVVLRKGGERDAALPLSSGREHLSPTVATLEVPVDAVPPNVSPIFPQCFTWFNMQWKCLFLLISKWLKANCFPTVLFNDNDWTILCLCTGFEFIYLFIIIIMIIF